jgi:hypothetical protein
VSLNEDFSYVLDVAERTDPSFATVDRRSIDRCVEDVKRHISQGSQDDVLLSMMRLLALAGNGHTRLIPNDAIRVLPLRFVSIGPSVYLTSAAPEFAAFSGSKLIAVNGTPVEYIERAARFYLAGTLQRQRVIGAILLAWPAALARLGYPANAAQTDYQLLSAEGRVTHLKVANANTVPAPEFYPRNEHGQASPVWGFDEFGKIRECSADGLIIRLPSFFDPDGNALASAIENAARQVRSHGNRPLLIDVRGNTGGDFKAGLPLIDAIAERARGCGCVVVVDKFTFSAAIVFVAILKYRLGSKLKFVGEEMGDGLRFFAEGGLIDLPTSGAVIRYSSALHNWETGSADLTTPPEIARHLVPVRKLDIDRQWVKTPFDTAARDEVYRKFIEELF